jgi:arylformamidase
MTGAAPARAPISDRTKGPLVFLDYDQAELDAAYSQPAYAPNMDIVLKRYAVSSEAARRRLGPPERLAYGPSEIEKLDLYRAKRPHAPINVFIHGGAWRRRAARDYAILAEMLAGAGAHLAVLDFAGVEDTDGRLMPIAEQVRRAVAWVHANAARLGADPARLYVSGHSSGGHLAGVVLTTDWRELGLPRDIIKGGLVSSGMYDLKPVRLSARSNYVKFDDTTEAALSSQRHIDKLACPIIVAHGTQETPEFQRQARDFAAAVQAAGKPVQLLVGEGYNHFEILETLANPYGLLGRAVLQQMGLV